jgi:malate dehydrogenase
MTSLSLMGVGKVGGEVAFLAAATGLFDEIALFDIAEPLLAAQILDLEHTGLDITISNDPAAIRDSDIFVFSAGTPRTPAIRTRADLLAVNLPVTNAAAKCLAGFGGVLITVTNPMDANNYYLWKKSGLPRERCIGFGGQLDSARMKTALKQKGISCGAWVLGEHGEHQVPLFSKCTEPVYGPDREAMLTGLRGASMEVIRGKGGTVFGPAYHIVDLVRAVLEDQKRVLPCSCVLDGEYGLSGCSVGVPAVIGRGGIDEIVEFSLDEWEWGLLREAASSIGDLCRQAGV